MAEVDLSAAVDCFNNLGMIHKIQPNETRYFSKYGLRLENDSGQGLLVIIMLDNNQV